MALDGLSGAIAKADYVICLCATWAGIDKLQESDGRMQGVARALSEAHAAKAKFVLLSDNLPVDGARFPEADAVVGMQCAEAAPERTHAVQIAVHEELLSRIH